MKLKMNEHIILCATCSVSLEKEDIECCENLALGKMFCKDCIFNKASKLTGFTIEELEKYLILDDVSFKIKMDEIKKKLTNTFKAYGEFERY